MSERLTASAVLSVLLMAGYVLFGGDAVRAPMGSGAMDAALQVRAPSLAPLRIVMAPKATARLLY